MENKRDRVEYLYCQLLRTLLLCTQRNFSRICSIRHDNRAAPWRATLIVIMSVYRGTRIRKERERKRRIHSAVRAANIPAGTPSIFIRVLCYQVYITATKERGKRICFNIHFSCTFVRHFLKQFSATRNRS